MHKRNLIQAVLCGAALLVGSAAFGQTQTGSSQALLDLLVKKGLITTQEASDLRAQAAQNAAAAAAAPAPTPAVPVAVPSQTGAGFVGSPDNTVVAGNQAAAPLSFRIGIANFSPVGFMDFTSVYRSSLNGGDIGSSFGSIPYANTANSQLSETRFSAKNSRLGMRIDSDIGDTKVLGYVEADFLGNAATNVNVASNSDVMRMRVYFADVRHGPWEILAGQDWSLLTPNRVGLSPMPSDIFYTQDVDTNYQVGLVWGRTPQLRAVYHATDSLTMGVSLENPDQYVGSAETLPSGFTNTTEVDNGSNGTATPNVMPDVIGKIAYDTKIGGNLPFHAEVGGLYSDFKINTYSATVNSSASTSGYGGSLNSSLSVIPGLSLIENAFYSDGGGRYISTGLGPDVIVTPANAAGAYGLSPVHSWSGLAGLEWDVLPTNKVFAYYGEADYQADYVQTGPTSYVGYGYPGSSNAQNHRIAEYTLGDSHVLWKNPTYGDLKILTQLSYVDRTPFYVATGAPSDAHLTMFYFDIRYDLP